MSRLGLRTETLGSVQRRCFTVRDKTHGPLAVLVSSVLEDGITSNKRLPFSVYHLIYLFIFYICHAIPPLFGTLLFISALPLISPDHPPWSYVKICLLSVFQSDLSTVTSSLGSSTISLRTSGDLSLVKVRLPCVPTDPTHRPPPLPHYPSLTLLLQSNHYPTPLPPNIR